VDVLRASCACVRWETVVVLRGGWCPTQNCHVGGGQMCANTCVCVCAIVAPLCGWNLWWCCVVSRAQQAKVALTDGGRLLCVRSICRYAPSLRLYVSRKKSVWQLLMAGCSANQHVHAMQLCKMFRRSSIPSRAACALRRPSW
jgi:hypothetical protein